MARKMKCRSLKTGEWFRDHDWRYYLVTDIWSCDRCHFTIASRTGGRGTTLPREVGVPWWAVPKAEVVLG